jgi:large subunit ribosomal protein L1
MVRGAVGLPHGIGKSVRVAVVASADKVAEANVGRCRLRRRATRSSSSSPTVSLIDKIDSVIATPDMMGKLGRLGKTLGPPGPDAEPEVGHRHDGRRARPSARSSRPGGVPVGPQRQRPRHPR